jgi:hypothetical protein
MCCNDQARPASHGGTARLSASAERKMLGENALRLCPLLRV